MQGRIGVFEEKRERGGAAIGTSRRLVDRGGKGSRAIEGIRRGLAGVTFGGEGGGGVSEVPKESIREWRGQGKRPGERNGSWWVPKMGEKGSQQTGLGRKGQHASRLQEGGL